MKRYVQVLAAFALVVLLPFVLAGCAIRSGAVPVTFPAAPLAKTTLDERGLLALELAYKAARIGLETAVDAGQVKGERARWLAELDRKAYAFVRAARTVREAGNADSAGAQADAALALIRQITEQLAIAGKVSS